MDTEDTGRLPLVNKLLYTSDQIESQAIAQTRNLWLLCFLVPSSVENPSRAAAIIGTNRT